MTNSQAKIIKKALLDVELIEIRCLESLPDVKFEHSSNYNDSINNLIKQETNRENSILKLSTRKKIIALAVSIITLLLVFTACVFRNEIKGFIVDFYGTMTKFLSSSKQTELEYIEYNFTYLPEGYELEKSTVTADWSYKKYYNGTHYLYINQSSIHGNSTQIDTLDATYEIINVGNYEIHRINKNNTYSVLWKIESNVFVLSCSDSIEWTEIEKIIINATPVTK